MRAFIIAEGSRVPVRDGHAPGALAAARFSVGSRCAAAAAATLAWPKFGPASPPRSTRWQSGLPEVVTTIAPHVSSSAVIRRRDQVENLRAGGYG